MTVRPGYDGGLAERTRHITPLDLNELSAAESAAMAEAMLASADLPAELHTLVGRKAEGNPFFVEEVIKAARSERSGGTASAGCSAGRWTGSQSRTPSRTC